MKKSARNVLMIGLYCFPFVHFAMYRDFTDGSMIGYLIMMIATSTLAFGAKYIDHTYIIIVGNLLSITTSYYFINSIDAFGWRGYFKPLSPQQLLILVSLLNLIPQLLAARLALKLKNSNNKRDI